jgi:tetratricopeptide (TPR) repeat protein
MHNLRLLRLFILVPACALAASSWGRGHALLIGIDQYGDRDGITRLAGAENDVEGLSLALQEAADIPKSNIEVLKGSHATKVGIIKALERLRDRSSQGDIVFFSFSGHGFQPAERAFLVPFDATAGSRAVLQSSSIEASEVARLLGQVNSDLLMACYDMCRNDPQGGLARSGSANTMSQAMQRDLRVVPEQTRQGPRRTVTIFASSEGQRSWERPQNRRGYFSWFLERGLRGEASVDGVVKVSSLIEYLESNVLSAVQSERQVDQRPLAAPEGSQALSYVLARKVIVPPNTKTEFDTLVQKALALTSKPGGIRSQKEAQEAQALLEEADALKPGDFNVNFHLAWTFDYQNKDTLALARYREAIRILPSYSVQYRFLADLYVKLGNPTEAIAAAREGLRVAPESADLHLTLGRLLTPTDLEGAEFALRRAVQSDPKLASAHRWLGHVLREKGSYAEAEDSYRRAIQLDPSVGWQYVRLANIVLYDLKRSKEETERIYRDGIKAANTDADLHFNFAKFLEMEAALVEEAEVQYRKAAELDPRDPEKGLRLGFVLYPRKPKEAESQFLKTLSENPTYINCYQYLSDFYSFYRRREDAAKIKSEAEKRGLKIEPWPRQP